MDFPRLEIGWQGVLALARGSEGRLVWAAWREGTFGGSLSSEKLALHHLQSGMPNCIAQQNNSDQLCLARAWLHLACSVSCVGWQSRLNMLSIKPRCTRLVDQIYNYCPDDCQGTS